MRDIPRLAHEPSEGKAVHPQGTPSPERPRPWLGPKLSSRSSKPAPPSTPTSAASSLSTLRQFPLPLLPPPIPASPASTRYLRFLSLLSTHPRQKKKSPHVLLVWAFRINPGGDLLSRAVAHAVPSALEGFTSVFGMGTGVSPPLWPPGITQLSGSSVSNRSALRPRFSFCRRIYAYSLLDPRELLST